MENSSIKKINTAGLIGYIISIILIVCTIIAMVAVGICTIGAIAISKDNINLKIDTNISINSTGNFLGTLNHFISINEVKDLNDLTNETKTLSDNDISEISINENDEGLVINAKTNEITISINKIIVALVAAFIFLGSITVALYMVKALMKLLKDCKTPFSENVIKSMTRFATSLVCVVICNIVLSGFWSPFMYGTNYKPSIGLGSILLVAVIYILITVFKYGAKLQQESDETL